MAQPPREWFEKDYYKVLGVSDSATEKEIGSGATDSLPAESRTSV